MGKVVIRVGAAVLLSVILALALGWLVEQVPLLAWLVYVGAGLGIAWTLWRLLRSENRLRSGLAIAATFMCSMALLALLSVVFAVDDGTEAAFEPPAPDPTSVPGPDDTTADTTATTVAADTVATTTLLPTTTVAAAPTTTVEVLAALELTVADADDCRCTDGAELLGLGVHERNGEIVIDVGTAASDTGRLWLWSLTDPGRPIVVDIATGAAPADGGWSIDVPGRGPWAVVSAGGDRVPDVGFAELDGSIADTSSSGPLATRFESELAAVQRAFPSLDPQVASLVGSLSARQGLEGTSTFRRTPDDPDDVVVDVVVTSRWPQFAQLVTSDGVFLQSLFAGLDEIVVCVEAGSGLSCESIDAVMPLSAAAAIVGDPGALVLEPVEAVPHDGGPTTCIRIVAVPAGGPSLGINCWLDNGMSSWSVRDGLDTVELVDLSADVDLELLTRSGDR